MRHIVLIFLLLFSLSAYGQGTIPFANGRTTDTANTPGSLKAGGVVRFLTYATSDTNKVLGINAQGILVWRTKSTGSGGGVTQETLDDSCNAIRADFPTGGGADSSVFATVYDVDTAKRNLRAADALKLNLSDTSTMLSGYTRITRFLDSISAVRGAIPNVSGYLPFTDTANMLLGYTRVNRFLDSLTAHWSAIQGKQPAGTYVQYITAGYGNLATGTTTVTIPADTATVFPKVLSTLSAGYGISYTILSRTYSADTSTLFAKYASTMANGYGISYSARTYTLDTSTVFAKYATTQAAGYGITYGSRTFTLDTATSYQKIRSTFYGDATVNSGGGITIKTSVALAGSPTTTTQSANDNSTKVATTAYVDVPMAAIMPQTTTAASYTGTITPTSTSGNIASTVSYIITAQAGALQFNPPTGSWVNGQILLFRILDNGTARALTYSTAAGGYRAGTTVTPPSTTVISKTLYLEYMYNSTADKFDLIGYADGF
jgi:hypothetical protein